MHLDLHFRGETPHCINGVKNHLAAAEHSGHLGCNTVCACLEKIPVVVVLLVVGGGAAGTAAAVLLYKKVLNQVAESQLSKCFTVNIYGND